MHLFYQPDNAQSVLTGDEAHHCARVLRLAPGTTIRVTDGKGAQAECRLTTVTDKKVIYVVEKQLATTPRPYRIVMAIAPTRKLERNEWMVEKMTEQGVDEIHFFVSEHTHLESFNRVVNLSRLERIAVSAMKQSQQVFKPRILLHQRYADFVRNLSESGSLRGSENNQFIAYVTDTEKPDHLLRQVQAGGTSAVLIGPEGDFSPEEIALALGNGFKSVSLGESRLRTETAAVLACHAVHLANLT
ncbi:16S rRNA (uracil(1498)-N(3))-methyltransferase [Rhabdobacter roseus]|uniref:Ribosomal RNA small subunit methyltransferase E n=1 Tax=Rhabdobacter roseus TaxID=1655419 RepID=A0A840TNU3_9BACT|nr:RsmE family RNA methyltransferase [Rhabdobacter roseus]MBB5283222.1 16S rRNA (uracil1498-N3)-methyltransferase [Rhabdobacter roseus]